MAFIESLLDKLDNPQAFEDLCCQLMMRENYPHIEPTGGPGDKGRDAQEKIYQSKLGDRLTFFQFTLEKTVPRKVRSTLARLAQAGLYPHLLIFIFSTRIVNAGLKDTLATEALDNYGLDIQIKDQKFLASRLGHPAFRDITTTFFAAPLAELRALWEEDKLFLDSTTVSAREQRSLVNLMHYARHPLAGDIKRRVTRQAALMALNHAQSPLPPDRLAELVADYLPHRSVPSRESILEEVRCLGESADVSIDEDGRYSLAPDTRAQIQLDNADIASAKKALYEQIGQSLVSVLDAIDPVVLRRTCDRFLSELFDRYGTEVAHALLGQDMADGRTQLSTTLSLDGIEEVLSQILSGWNPSKGKSFRDAIWNLLTQPSPAALIYLNALAGSYILMQTSNIDPNGINIQRARIKDSVAVLDTDVVLTGIVDGATHQLTSLSIVRLCQKLGLRTLATQEGIEEIVYRIQRSIELYNDLGRPALIPPDKSDLISDILLDIYFQRLVRGQVRSFGEYISEYYDPQKPSDHVRNLIDLKLGIAIEPLNKYYIKVQDRKIKALQETIEASRQRVGRFKASELYYKDALQMVVVDQQNHQAADTGKPGRWYLVSNDRHILGAYLTHPKAFLFKPCILPALFLENLRTAPEATADPETFGTILHSEVMLRGLGRDYTPILAALSSAGVAVLELPRERLLTLIEDMDRADFTEWLLVLKSGKRIDPAIRDEISAALARVLRESASRDQQLKVFKELAHRAKPRA